MVELKNNMIFKKLKASSITETIVATTIIIIVFTMAIFVLNNILKNVVENDTSAIERKMNAFIYKSQYKEVLISTTFEEGNWIVNLEKERKNNIDFIAIKALNRKTKKKIIKTIVNAKNE